MTSGILGLSANAIARLALSAVLMLGLWIYNSNEARMDDRLVAIEGKLDMIESQIGSLVAMDAGIVATDAAQGVVLADNHTRIRLIEPAVDENSAHIAQMRE